VQRHRLKHIWRTIKHRMPRLLRSHKKQSEPSCQAHNAFASYRSSVSLLRPPRTLCIARRLSVSVCLSVLSVGNGPFSIYPVGIPCKCEWTWCGNANENGNSDCGECPCISRHEYVDILHRIPRAYLEGAGGSCPQWRQRMVTVNGWLCMV